ncbi:leucine-rich repeat flightless-interacting protein 2 isoform X2 [Neocloeon triangulifer]|uniref:leucine-rich repeat flightless-interacting protein 2 isoform X2 n=1 Tax=Neocloeon triangulifer TaxID=2078957 RepID=UPI00286F6058|nr:leucine-rich repeat flightless-interacting protein 2 isoform X2 [Neocloeon triangulifer]
MEVEDNVVVGSDAGSDAGMDWTDARESLTHESASPVDPLSSEYEEVFGADRSDDGGGAESPSPDDKPDGPAEKRPPSCEEPEERDDNFVVDSLGKIANEAEARLAARRQARAEAREIRMRELERQQKESEQSSESPMYPLSPAEVKQQKLDSSAVRARVAVSSQRSLLSTQPSNYQSSRRSSEDSMEDGLSLRDMRQEMKDLDEKFKKAMFHNAQLDNEKASFSYQVELLKDQIEQLEEAHFLLQKEHRDKCKEYGQLKRDSDKVVEERDVYKAQLEERDRLIQEAGLVIVGEDYVSSEEEDSDEEDEDSEKSATPPKQRKALVSADNAQLLDAAGQGSLDVRLRRFKEERDELQDQVRHLKLELEEERNRNLKGSVGSTYSVNGPNDDEMDLQREASKQLGDYKFKLQKAEQDISTLQANVARLESQVLRYKTAAETSEKAEEELKTEKRKLQREVRNAQQRIQTLEANNWALQKQVNRLKEHPSAAPR